MQNYPEGAAKYVRCRTEETRLWFAALRRRACRNADGESHPHQTVRIRTPFRQRIRSNGTDKRACSLAASPIELSLEGSLPFVPQRGWLNVSPAEALTLPIVHLTP